MFRVDGSFLSFLGSLARNVLGDKAAMALVVALKTNATLETIELVGLLHTYHFSWYLRVKAEARPVSAVCVYIRV